MKPSFGRMFVAFFKIGCVSFGGYMAIISMVERELAEKRDWLKRGELLDYLAIGNMLPGPIAVNVSSFSGYLVYGWKGFFASWLGLLLPAFASCLVLAQIYSLASGSDFFAAFSFGMLVAITAVIAASIKTLAADAISDSAGLTVAIVSAAVFLWSPFGSPVLAIAVLYIAALTFVAARLWNAGWSILFQSLSEAFWVVVPLVSVCAAVAVVKTLGISFENKLLDLSSNLGASSLMLFGGAYSFVPIVGNVVVGEREWMSMEGFMDSVAVGQISPGPVLIAGAYIGYSVQGVAGAVIATVAMFLPSALMMVYAGEKARRLTGNRLVTGMLDILKPVIIGLLCGGIVQIVWRLAGPEEWAARLVFGAAFAVSLWLLIFRKINHMYLIFGCGALYSISSFVT